MPTMRCVCVCKKTLKSLLTQMPRQTLLHAKKWLIDVCLLQTHDEEHIATTARSLMDLPLIQCGILRAHEWLDVDSDDNVIYLEKNVALDVAQDLFSMLRRRKATSPILQRLSQDIAQHGQISIESMKVWSHLVFLLAINLTQGAMHNEFFPMLEGVFSSDDEEVRWQAMRSWRYVAMNFFEWSETFSNGNSSGRLGLLMRPIVNRLVHETVTSIVHEEAMNLWFKLLEKFAAKSAIDRVWKTIHVQQIIRRWIFTKDDQPRLQRNVERLSIALDEHLLRDHFNVLISRFIDELQCGSVFVNYCARVSELVSAASCKEGSMDDLSRRWIEYVLNMSKKRVLGEQKEFVLDVLRTMVGKFSHRLHFRYGGEQPAEHYPLACHFTHRWIDLVKSVNASNVCEELFNALHGNISIMHMLTRHGITLVKHMFNTFSNLELSTQFMAWSRIADLLCKQMNDATSHPGTLLALWKQLGVSNNPEEILQDMENLIFDGMIFSTHSMEWSSSLHSDHDWQGYWQRMLMEYGKLHICLNSSPYRFPSKQQLLHDIQCHHLLRMLNSLVSLFNASDSNVAKDSQRAMQPKYMRTIFAAKASISLMDEMVRCDAMQYILEGETMQQWLQIVLRQVLSAVLEVHGTLAEQCQQLVQLRVPVIDSIRKIVQHLPHTWRQCVWLLQQIEDLLFEPDGFQLPIWRAALLRIIQLVESESSFDGAMLQMMEPLLCRALSCNDASVHQETLSFWEQTFANALVEETLLEPLELSGQLHSLLREFSKHTHVTIPGEELEISKVSTAHTINDTEIPSKKLQPPSKRNSLLHSSLFQRSQRKRPEKCEQQVRKRRYRNNSNHLTNSNSSESSSDGEFVKIEEGEVKKPVMLTEMQKEKRREKKRRRVIYPGMDLNMLPSITGASVTHFSLSSQDYQNVQQEGQQESEICSIAVPLTDTLTQAPLQKLDQQSDTEHEHLPKNGQQEQPPEEEENRDTNLVDTMTQELRDEIQKVGDDATQKDEDKLHIMTPLNTLKTPSRTPGGRFTAQIKHLLADARECKTDPVEHQFSSPVGNKRIKSVASQPHVLQQDQQHEQSCEREVSGSHIGSPSTQTDEQPYSVHLDISIGDISEIAFTPRKKMPDMEDIADLQNLANHLLTPRPQHERGDGVDEMATDTSSEDEGFHQVLPSVKTPNSILKRRCDKTAQSSVVETPSLRKVHFEDDIVAALARIEERLRESDPSTYDTTQLIDAQRLSLQIMSSITTLLACTKDVKPT